MSKTMVMIGLPGSGKGTQVSLLVATYGFTRVSTGDFVRRTAAEDTPFGNEVKGRMEQGVPQPDAVITRIMEEHLAPFFGKADLLFDSFPLSDIQAQNLEAWVAQHNLGAPLVIVLDVSPQEIMHRLTTRRVCSACHLPVPPDFSATNDVCPRCSGQVVTRSDDKSEVVAERIKEYQARMEAIEQFYQGKREVVHINGEQSVEAVHEAICAELKSRGYVSA